MNGKSRKMNKRARERSLFFYAILIIVNITLFNLNYCDKM